MSISRICSLLVLALAGCGGSDDLATSHAAIANGAPDEHRGVVVVVTEETGTICSGVVVAPRVVLTARHCIAPVENGPSVDCVRTRFGTAADAGSITIGASTEGATANRRHSVVKVLVPDSRQFCGNDVAALIMSRPLTEAVVVPVRAEEARAGERFTALGFGRNGAERSGTRRRREGLRVACVGTNCENRQLTEVEWWGDGAVCDGDSGGPALDEEGRVIGIASRKRENCAATVYLDVASSSRFVTAAIDEAARTPEGEEAAACSYGRGSAGAAPFAALFTLAAARSRRSRRRRRDCAHTPAPSAPPRSV